MADTAGDTPSPAHDLMPRPAAPALLEGPPGLAARARAADPQAPRGALAVRLAEAVGDARAGGRPRLWGLDPAALAEADPQIAGDLYQHLMAAEAAGRRRDLGAWYTPPAVAAWAVEAAAPVGASGAGRWIDPACGTGAFLLAAGRRAVAAARAAGVADPAGRAAEALWGVDRDPEALAVCRAVLAVEGLALGADRLVCADALASPWPLDASDAVVGNPPFVNIVRLPEAERAALKARFTTFRNKCDLYGLFVEAGVRHLAPGGRLAFVVSDSFLGADSFALLRQRLFLAGDLTVRGLHRLADGGFDAAARTVVLVVERRAPGPEEVLRLGRLGLDGGLSGERRVPLAALAARARISAALPADPSLLEAAVAMGRVGAPLGERVAFSLGVKTGDDRRFVTDAPQGPPGWAPAVRGRQVQPWRVGGPLWLDYRPEVLATVHGARPRRPGTFRRPLKILLRETSGRRLVAAMDRAGRVPLDTLHVLHHREGARPPFSLWYLLALLDSRSLGAWYGLHHPGPHVKANEVRALPVPDPPPERPADLPAAVAALTAWLLGPGREASLPAPCLAPGARQHLLGLLARWLTDAPADHPARPRAQAAVDRLAAESYGPGGRVLAGMETSGAERPSAPAAVPA